MSEQFLEDPNNPGWIKAWGVVRKEPWHLAGYYSDEKQAIEFREAMGDGYEVHYGSYRRGTTDFIWS